MAEKKSTMSPTRLFILLCFAGILMWLFSSSEIDVEIDINSDLNKTEDVIKHPKPEKTNNNSTRKKERKGKKKKTEEYNPNRNYNYKPERSYNYDPSKRD